MDHRQYIEQPLLRISCRIYLEICLSKWGECMQISDLFRQYELKTKTNTNARSAETVTEAGETSASKELSDVLRNLFAGDIFEATVNEMKNGEVTLGLENGQTIQARLQAQVQLHVGEAMFFQIKSNQGAQIEIKPFPMGAEGNPTLLKALDAAGLKVNDKNLSLVHSMMEQQLPIDKDSLLAMVRLCGSHPSIPRSTLVEMTKFQIPVTEENAAVFENYKMDQGKIEGQLEQIFRDLPQKLEDGSVSIKETADFHNKLVGLLLGEEEQSLDGQKIAVSEQNFATDETGNTPLQEQNQSTLKTGEDVSNPALANQKTGENEPLSAQENGNAMKSAKQAETQQMVADGKIVPNAKEEQISLLLHTMKETEILELNQALATLTGEKTDVSKLTAKQLLQTVRDFLTRENAFTEENVKELFSKKSYQQVLRNALETEWLLTPKDIADSEKRRDFYTKMDRQMGQLSEILAQNTQTMGKTMQALGDIQNNLQFMHVLNQTYTYMQIPLKMSNQNAQGDLYVYTNKKNLHEKEGELSAFLHLDLEHLGATDVSVKMLGKKVDTKFYLSDDAAYHLILEHAPLLEEQLKKKGYHCTIDVENEEKKPDFVEDLLQRGKPVGGALHRYSFDMRA